MTQIDFYVLDEQATGDRYQLACRVAERAHRSGKRVLIHSQDVTECAHVDTLLWTFREQGFLPHGLLGRDDARCNPILIGDGHTDDSEHDVLINLAAEVPAFFGRFQRLIECVDHDADVKAASRQRFRYYRDHGYPLNTHTISS